MVLLSFYPKAVYCRRPSVVGEKKVFTVGREVVQADASSLSQNKVITLNGNDKCYSRFS